VPFLRFSRDKRGYENVYLVHAQNRRGKPSRPRVLYWYRTPPGIKVGRPPFDEEARRRLESQNPDVTFDWPTIIATPMPPPAENEQWRERRRAERAAKQAQRAEEEAAMRDAEAAEQPDTDGAEELATADALPDSLLSDGNEAETSPPDSEAEPHNGPDSPIELAADTPQRMSPQTPTDRPQDPSARRRRRRGGRRRRGTRQPGPSTDLATSGGENPGAPTDPDQQSSETLADSDPPESIESTDE
jgi:hypothetical protein